jgi:hypothetical protein
MNTVLAFNLGRPGIRAATRRPAAQIAEKMYRRHLDFAPATVNFAVTKTTHRNRWRDVDLAIVAIWAAVAIFWTGVIVGWMVK